MKKKLFVPMLMSGALLFGGVVGASSTTLQNGVEGLKEQYTNKHNEWSMGNEHELGIYEEGKLVEIEDFASAYYEEVKSGALEAERALIDEEFEEKKAEMKSHIDNLFNKK